MDRRNRKRNIEIGTGNRLTLAAIGVIAFVSVGLAGFSDVAKKYKDFAKASKWKMDDANALDPIDWKDVLSLSPEEEAMIGPCRGGIISTVKKSIKKDKSDEMADDILKEARKLGTDRQIMALFKSILENPEEYGVDPNDI